MDKKEILIEREKNLALLEKQVKACKKQILKLKLKKLMARINGSKTFALCCGLISSSLVCAAAASSADASKTLQLATVGLITTSYIVTHLSIKQIIKEDKMSVSKCKELDLKLDEENDNLAKINAKIKNAKDSENEIF